VRDLHTGEVGLLDAEVLASVSVADAQSIDVGDVVWTRGRLWKVRSPLDDGGETIVLQLTEAQHRAVDVAGDSVYVVIVGDPDGSAPVVALAPAGVLRRSVVVSLAGDSYRVGTPTVCPAGGLRRYLLTPV
jgi:tartrate dehydratase beta subunit/fumarate hydratase class I family protein